MHKSNVLSHLKSWEKIFRRTFETEAKFSSLSSSDQDTVCTAFQIWISICFDICSTRTSSDAAMAFFMNMKSVAMHGDALSYYDIIRDCDACDQVLLSNGRLSKRDVRQQTCIGWLRKLVYHFTDYPFRELHQVLSFCKRITIQSDKELGPKTEISYFDNLGRVANLELPQADVNAVAKVVSTWSRTFVAPSVDDLAFGNGQVSQCLRSKSRMRKFANLTDSTRSDYLWNHLFEEGNVENRPLFGKIPLRQRPDHVTAPKARLQFVPKSYKTFRSICMEDLEMSFFQHAMFAAMARWIKTIPGNPIDLENQERSCALARIGSIRPDTYATIDLSMASDSVSYRLAKEVFWNTPLRVGLFATRSGAALYTRTDGTEVEFDLPMFAAMGSALCFPVECVIFAAIVQSVIDEHYPDGLKAIVPKWYVYGDDIVCETWLAPFVKARLRRLGFLVNDEKSFDTTTNFFREACGGEYFQGQDVAPVRIPRNFRALKRAKSSQKSYSFPTGSLECYYTLSNELFARGYTFARLVVIDQLTSVVPRQFLPWSDNIEAIALPSGSRHASGMVTNVMSSELFTPQPPGRDKYDRATQRAYRLVLQSTSSRDKRYFSIRGQLIAALAPTRHASEPSYSRIKRTKNYVDRRVLRLGAKSLEGPLTGGSWHG